MYRITDEEARTVKAMRQAYDRLKDLGWQDIVRFKPEMKDFVSAPFLGIEFGSDRPIECEHKGRRDDGRNIFVSIDNDDEEERTVNLILFRHYKDG
jgi:hypothetical protein